MADTEAATRRYFAALAAHDVDAVVEAFAPDGVRSQNGASVQGRDSIRAVYATISDCVEMTDLVIKTLLVVGSTAVTEYVERGTQRRAVRTGFGVIEASNKSFTVHGLAITEFDGDLIRSHRVYSDGAFQMLAHSPTSSWTTRKHP